MIELIDCDASSLNVIEGLLNAMVIMRDDPGEELMLMECALELLVDSYETVHLFTEVEPRNQDHPSDQWKRSCLCGGLVHYQHNTGLPGAGNDGPVTKVVLLGRRPLSEV